MTLDYKVMEGSLYNTPPCWSIYVCGLVFKHLLAAGGLPGVKANNDAKAQLVRCLRRPGQSPGPQATQYARKSLASNPLVRQFLTEEVRRSCCHCCRLAGMVRELCRGAGTHAAYSPVFLPSGHTACPTRRSCQGRLQPRRMAVEPKSIGFDAFLNH